MKLILELDDHGTPVQVEISQSGSFVAILESGVEIYLTVKALADIAGAVAQYLEIESAAEYIDEEPLFTEEDLEAGRRSIAEYCETVRNHEKAPF